MTTKIPEHNMVGYLIELLEEYVHHGISYVMATVEEGAPGYWTFKFTFKFTDEDDNHG